MENLKRQESVSDRKSRSRKREAAKQGSWKAGCKAEKCRTDWKDWLAGMGIVAVIGFFFYRSLWSLPFLAPVYLLYQREAAKDKEQKRRRETAIQFKDAILSVSANQKAGYSVENAFRQAYGDMVLLYGKDSGICREWYAIVSGLGSNMVLEDMMYGFGKRSGVEEIMEFAQVFAAAKRNGGNLTEVIERSASVIEDKVETEKEIQIVISARKLEQRIMNVVPFGSLLYISAGSKGFFDVLYHNPAGVLVMTVCLAVYMAAVVLSRKIVNIEV